MQSIRSLDDNKQTLLSVSQVSGRLDMSRSFIYQELSSGRLEHYKLGKIKGRIRVSEKQLAEYLENFRKGNERPALPPVSVTIPPSMTDVSKNLTRLLS